MSDQIEITDEMVCCTCGIRKPLNPFSKSNKRTNGFRRECKNCEKNYKEKKKKQFFKMSTKELQEHIYYDSSKGVFFINGTTELYPSKVSNTGYLFLNICGCKIGAHRVAFYLENDRWGKAIDHINGDRLDNRIVNLRECSNIENNCNRDLHREGRLVGATFCKDRNKWHSQVRDFSGKQINNGYYETEREASLAYCRYVLKHGLSRREFLPAQFSDEELYTHEAAINEALALKEGEK